MNSLFSALLIAPLLTHAFPFPLPFPTPPNIPSASAAQTQLASLQVAPQGPQTGYSRALFPHWITQYGTCNTREVVLKRDGTSVVQDASCAAASGQWYSPYDGASWTLASDLDIDHVVPLSNAWKARTRLSSLRQVAAQSQSFPFFPSFRGKSRANPQTKSGAAAWTTARRQAFANDLTNPQLIAITDNVNEEKGDSGPEDWQPPITSYHCTYAKMWVKVKSTYSLSVTSAEKAALVGMLDSC